MNSPLRGVLFDLDGTLLDTAPDMIAALNQLRAEHNATALPYDLARTQVSHGSSGLVRLGFPELQGEAFEQLRLRFLDLYTARLTNETALFEGFEVVLATLEQRAMPWGIVTNKPAFLTDPLLAALGLDRRAGAVVSGDTLPQRKPHPAPLLLAASQLQLPPATCLYVGDAERDVQSARAAGMPVLVARYGYLGPRRRSRCLEARCADRLARRTAAVAGRAMIQGELSGRVIAITGATGGIGRAVALDCARQGAQVVLLARNLRKLQGLHAELEQIAPGAALMAPLDLEKALAADYDRIAGAITDHYGRLDGLVHCAALLGSHHAARAVRRTGLVPRHARERDRGLRVDPGAVAGAASLRRCLGDLHHQRRRSPGSRVLGGLRGLEVRGRRARAGAGG